MSETEDDMTLDEYRGRVLRDAETHGRVVKLTGPQSVSDPSPHAHGVPVEGCVWCDLDTATAVPAAKTESLSLGSVIVACPTCSERIPIQVHVASGVDADGYPVIACTPDTSAAWDHYEDRHMKTQETDHE